MSVVLCAFAAAFGAGIAGIAYGIFRLHGTMTKHHLRGRYTWAEEIAAWEDKHREA